MNTPTSKMQELRGNKISMIFQEPMTSLNPVFRIGRQARQAAGSFVLQEKKRPWQGPVWAGLGALVTGLVWVLTVVL